ncbi:MAG: aminotransferase class V-fold PLP-dependent enzyme [Planctomycetales bacterium]|nr:aminotransferase class V-fold PLP-dependent enzyme [Planctomycetales bacterium]MBN8625932.1 aminotransferase class V-fold PLP-dependent enzyme [Planctomycetota bacterium]
MPDDCIYMDNHATTRVDPRVVEAMLPYFTERYGNAGSVNHPYGWEAKDAVDAARASIAQTIGAGEREIVFTSGATESNNLAIKGVAERSRKKGSHIITVGIEHKSVLDVVDKLSRRGYEVTLLPVEPIGSETCGLVDLDQLAAAIRPDTVLVSVMAANNEIGVLQPIAEIGRLCRERGVTFHCDATQAVGKILVDVARWNVDLVSFTAHKIYGPKGIGALYVRRSAPAVRLVSQIDGGGQEAGFRSGTLNVPGIVGFARALELCIAEILSESERLATLRRRLYQGLTSQLDGVALNGPSLERPELRLPGNLNLSFAYVDGEALMMSMKRLAVSSGSACTSANPEPSHVLRALGLGDDLTRASLRYGLGRFNTSQDVETAIELTVDAVRQLRRLSSMA